MAGLGHIAVGLAAGRFADRFSMDYGVLGRAMLFFSALSMLPDADVVAFAAGVPYEAPFGHRGATHSLVAAIVFGIWAGPWGTLIGQTRLRTTLLATAVVATHGLLDTLTDGGRGVALLWPFSYQRFFAPWRPIPVSPIGLDVISPYGFRVMATELVYFSPLLLYALWPRKKKPLRSP